MNPHTKQSRQPKLLTKDQLIAQFTRGMEAHGDVVHVQHGNGIYQPKLEISVWKRLDGKKEAKP